MKLFLFAFLFLAGRVIAQEPQLKVELVGDAGETMPVVTLVTDQGADQLIVDAFYYIDASGLGIPRRLLLHKVSVVPAVIGIGVAADSVPAPKREVQSVHVTFVKSLAAKDFKFQ